MCEGKRPKSASGKPMKVCTDWLVCPCSCHADISEMFAMTGQARQVMDNPDYVPGPHMKVYIPTPAEVMEERLRSRRRDEAPEQIVKSENPDIPDAVLREFKETESGRSPRGALEQNVRLACDAWVALNTADDCDTKYVSSWIYENLGVTPAPSRGAIDAVWKRWTQIGFAVILGGPTRFVFYTPEGRKFGLEGMKEKFNRDKKHAETAMKLGRR